MIHEENAKTYCCEDISKIENYDLAIKAEDMWDCHHKKEIELNVGMDGLIEQGLYYGRQANELIFLSRPNHIKLHRDSGDISGEKNGMYQKGYLLTGEKNGNYGSGTNHWKEGSYEKWYESITNKSPEELAIINYKKGSHARGRHWKMVNGKRVYIDGTNSNSN